MKYVIHRNDNRGKGEYGWLKTRYSFSFSEWYDPERMGFGKLRVLNDDIIAPRKGFGSHSHKNFEIITIVTEGTVTHEDSMGNKGEIHADEVQVMSAGTGVTHAEFNDSSKELRLFQIWIEPDKINVKSRYDQKKFKKGEKNAWHILVSSGDVPNSLMIHQNARISRIELGSQKTIAYSIAYSGNAAYAFVVNGAITVQNTEQLLADRDAIGIWDATEFMITAETDASLLVIEIPKP